jgi:hypothetical protein
MAPPNATKAATALADSDLRGVHLAGQRDASSLSHSTPEAQAPRHHCDSLQRRPKTLNELIAGAEFIELYDRRFPGRMARGARP